MLWKKAARGKGKLVLGRCGAVSVALHFQTVIVSCAGGCLQPKVVAEA
jgi:hypothetical protein